MKEVIIKNAALEKAAAEGMDAFLRVFVDGIYSTIGGELNAETLPQLGSEQVTLLAYHILREEVMQGGFIQLIHNGYGPFFFRNPFARAMREWGLVDLGHLIGKVAKRYKQWGAEIERDCDDETFMALYEQYPKFDDFDDEFIENEEAWTGMVAYYVDEHIENFVKITD